MRDCKDRYRLRDGDYACNQKIGDRFVVEGSCTFNGGSIVEFYDDDGSPCPMFKLVEGSCNFQGIATNDGGRAAFARWDTMSKVLDKKEVKMGFSYANGEEVSAEVGDNFLIAEDGQFSKGSVVQLMEDDGSSCPLFKLVGGGAGNPRSGEAYEFWHNMVPYSGVGPDMSETLALCKASRMDLVFTSGGQIMVVDHDLQTSKDFKSVEEAARVMTLKKEYLEAIKHIADGVI